MRKIAVLVVFLLAVLSPHVFASQAFEEVLSRKINTEGIFENERGVIFAEEIIFEGNSLLVVSARAKTVTYEIYGDADGIQLTDTISFDLSSYSSAKTGITKTGEKNCIVLSYTQNGKQHSDFYILSGDAIARADAGDLSDADYIAGYENGKIISYKGSGSAYNFLNRLKEQTISEYTFTNRVNSISDEEMTKIRATVSACADIMSFDIKSYDYDSLFKYVLYTHGNFRVLTDIPPLSAKSSTLGYNNVYIVSSDFIDYVMTKIFRITPEKPPVNNLISRGFCYNDGYYLYTGGFDVYFATEIVDFIGVYDIGGGALYTVFSDIYREGNSQIPEYSFAILQRADEGYSLLRLGMGESLLSENEVKRYSPYSTYQSSSWDGGKREAKNVTNDFLLPLLLLVFSVGAVGLVCSIIILIRSKK